MKKFKKYFNIWWMMSRNSFSVVIGQKLALSVFLIGKIFRFIFFFGFLYFLLVGSGNLAGYSSNQIIFFFLTFNLIDVITQFLFREVYNFRPMIINGDFDLVLVKPISALFRVLMGGADVIDLITIPPLIILTIYFGSLLHPGLVQIGLFLILLANGFLIATAFHIIVLSFAIVTLEVDHTVMIYRDLTSLGRLPIDIYQQPLKAFLTYLIPVGIMITLPAKAIMGLTSLPEVLIAFLVGLIAIFISFKFWNYALTKYSSASS
ncbi:MAG: ABC-2 family transporter protein [Candidatus Microgenomates bacterium]|jgi:ABC-2 type transport system permease protein